MAGNTRMLAFGGSVVVFAAGIGGGYTLHGDGKTAGKPVAVATSAASSTAPSVSSLEGTLTLEQGAFEWDQASDGSTPCVGYQG